MKSDNRIQILFRNYLNNTCTESEINELFDHFGLTDDQTLLRRLVRAELEKEEIENNGVDELVDRVDLRIKNFVSNIHAPVQEPAPVRAVTPLWKWLITSAAVLTIISISGLLLRHTPWNRVKNVYSEIPAGKPEPATERAFFTSADGKKMILDSTSSNQLPNTPQVSGINTLNTPKGGTYKVTLADGSIVWLNASSELKYPGSFSANERKVFLKGEAFFQISKDASKPFRVVVEGRVIEVLGTTFNVNAYQDKVQATLVEGSIRILNQSKASLLRPGEQAIISENGTAVSPVNIEPSIAWKKGDFYFQNDDFIEIMNEIERWYDIRVIYTGSIPPRKFVGSISRKVELSEVLEMLKEVTGASFKLKGRTLQVKFN
ncbi:FecR family protein [Desertivirga brevis]|uniref:FecR family protein n=1 Tax=Desertivirga brevis TaxID=2810310 RepID=UPI001A9678E8|nr:FecR family protein [Pedobacter sp. SYSU D00873]